MSEPLTREERENLKKAPISANFQRALNDLEALEKQHAADLEAQQAAMLACIREERVSKQAQLEACKKVAGEFRMAVESQGKDMAALRAQLEWCESERNAARARCEQLEAALLELSAWPESYPANQNIERMRRKAHAVLGNSTIAPETPAKEPA